MADETNVSLSNTRRDLEKNPEVILDENGQAIIIEYQETQKRPEWARLEFVLTCIGTAVGLGNIWRFPYLCFKYGGGAFLIPYVITLCFIGLPMFFMELALGQFSSLSAIGIWSISPLFKGVGYGMITVSATIAIYYNVIIAQCMYYFGVSFTSLLPWTNCNNSWNNQTLCYDGTDNSSLPSSRVSPAEEYYEKFVLNKSENIYDFGLPQWKIFICLCIAWIVVIVILLKGIKYMGKVSYFIALFPYIILTILLIRGALLPGSLNGITYYIIPDFRKLINPIVWVEAATQIFFSLSICNGSLITLSSYNRFKNNCLRDAVLVAVINCATSVYAGFVIFTNLGYMAFIKNVSLSEVVKGGPGLAFIVYPEAITRMPVSPLWSVLFFLMMFTLGFGSQISVVETLLTGLLDEFTRRKLFISRKKQMLFRICVCLILFILGIPMTCRGGMYLLGILDGAITGYGMLFLAVFELVVVSYCYGIEQFLKDIKLMIGERPNKYWEYSWRFTSPALIVILIIGMAASSSVNSQLSSGMMALQTCISLIPVFLTIIYFIVVYCQKGGFLLLKELRKPLHDWGPSHEEHKSNYHLSLGELNPNANLPNVNNEAKRTNFFQSKETIADVFIRRVDKVVNGIIHSTPDMREETLGSFRKLSQSEIIPV